VDCEKKGSKTTITITYADSPTRKSK